MNKVILMGRLTRDPEVRVSTGERQTNIGRFSIAVDRRFKREGQPDADFFNCTCFGKQAEFIEKYLHKGTKVVVVGSVQNDNYTKQDGSQVYSVQIMVDEIEFAESKNSSEGSGAGYQPAQPSAGANDFMNIPDGIVEELPFN
jgi:single-strand DNA-binding protein